MTMRFAAADTASDRVPLAELYDLIVLGGGAGGLTAALVAALEGQRVLLIEKNAQVGGTSARSSGTVWIPDNPQMREQGVRDDAGLAMQYLDALVGDRAPRGLRRAFLAAGPELIAYLRARTDIEFRPYPHAPDYRQDMPGAALGWRPLEPAEFDGRKLGPRFKEIGWPIPELTLFNGMMITRGEATRLLKALTDWEAFRLGARLVARYAMDRLRHPRGTRLVLGNALVAMLYRQAIERGVTILLNGVVSKLSREGGRVSGVIVGREGGSTQVRARRGVVLAGGGFPANAEWRERYLPSPAPRYTPAFDGCTGETISLALSIGASLGPAGEDNGFWFPSSVATRKDGSTAVYPHIVLDRAKPGLVAVNAAGRRFVNEAVSYHEFTRAMYRAHRRVACIPAYLVCDRAFVWKHGLGMIRPRTPFLGRYIESGYLIVAGTIRELAVRIGADPEGLAETVRRNNDDARAGIDTEFGKGGNAYDRAGGDAEHRPNPCLGAIERPPFCAVAVLPTPLATSLGLLTNASAQVLDREGNPLEGLYACGNDMHSIFGGEYPGAGAQLAQAMVFAYLAARHAAGSSRGESES